MKMLFRIMVVAAALAVCCSCQPSASELAKEYQQLTKELAQARLAGDDEAVERIKDKMDDLNERIEDAAEREAKKAKKEIKKGAKKLGNEIEDAFEDLVK